ncbi:hypothetical protein KCP69_06360 [Salmonella enterica subsp. enterica]|nr:hypothetical protein KCP69_06360 [Salmonella enterica subsp. enterica]
MRPDLRRDARQRFRLRQHAAQVASGITVQVLPPDAARRTGWMAVPVIANGDAYRAGEPLV